MTSRYLIHLAIACGGGALVLAAASSAHAQGPAAHSPTTQPLATSLTGDARASYEVGKLLLDDHDYAGASVKFRAAYDASHDARLLWNLALCEKEQRHYARASVLVDRFISDTGTSVGAEQIAQARATQGVLKQFFSLVTFDVQPPGAIVTVDGEVVVRAPRPAPVAVDIGKHKIKVQHEGFVTSDLEINISGQQPTVIKASLDPVANISFLAVNPSDLDDTVAIDNRVVGKGTWSGTLTPGPHEVKVTHEGMQPHIAELSLGADEHRSLDVTLDKEKSAALWPWLVGGGAVVVAGAVVGGYFLFKPSDTQEAFPSTQLQNISLRSVHAKGAR